ncbi:hypothetical protein [Mesoterricola silvestris]|uniref:Uncharacterized protein n=1 Tax=Mesoterricola silvestris TaxID=2927979 RepID=A0AA48GRP7_9BACT|nr:hypothetical protein [Mesoterricola silvestris]BDU74924.1 hypothetical protein METEAL_40980 [Mesoterricola silvestris]
MIGLCLVLLLGGTPASAPPGPAMAAVELRRAVVVPEEALEAALTLEEAGEAPEPPVASAPVALRKASVLRASDPHKEY